MPNYALASQRIERLEISLEICSEAPGYNESWPSDIFFEINGINLGKWICPGDFGSRPGALTPEWYNMGTQYGLLKTIKVDEAGSYVDGSRISDITIDDLDLASGVPIEFSVINPKDAQNRGGVTLFGKSFGNYSQDIILSMWTQER
jgi:predicted transcriptional regulator